MSKVKYVEQRRRSDGKHYWVYNPPGALKALIGNATFVTFDDRRDAEDHAKHVNALYEDAKARNSQKIYIDAGTVRGLVTAYKRSVSWHNLRPNSQITYAMLFQKALEIRLGNSNVPVGEMHHSNFKTPHAEALYYYLKEHVSEHRANHTVKVFRRMWTVLTKSHSLRENPFSKMGIKGLPERIVLWEPEQVMKFIQTADEAGYWSIGTLALLCYDLCQRPGDMNNLTWSKFDGSTFDFVQGKTRQRVTIPASPRILQRLHGINGEPSDHILKYEATGKPYGRYDYYKLASRIRNLAGLPSHLQIRDLRRTGATEMAEAGVTEDELRAVTGHRSRDILNTYVRPTRKMAAHGMMKRFAV